jgi:aldehyde dehydrogenase (NAD+)
VAFAGPGDLRRAVEAANRAQPGWAALSGLERGKYLFRIARLIQERARELAIVESLDGGKPIRESRDVDVPLAAAHFFYYAGWADKLSYGVGGRTVGAAGRGAPDRAVELPAADGGLEAGAGARVRQRLRAQAGETTPLTALLLARSCRRPSCRRAWCRSSQGDGAAGAALVREPDIDKVAFTGSTGGRQGHPGGAGGPRESRSRSELGGKSANIVFEDAGTRPGGRGHRQRDLLQPGPRLLRRVAAADPGERRRRRGLGKLWERMGRCGSGDPLDKNTDVGAINSREQLERIESLVERRGGGRRAGGSSPAS